MANTKSKARRKPYAAMSKAELAAATAQYDRESPGAHPVDPSSAPGLARVGSRSALTRLSILRQALPNVACPDGYDGKFGVKVAFE